MRIIKVKKKIQQQNKTNQPQPKANQETKPRPYKEYKNK